MRNAALRHNTRNVRVFTASIPVVVWSGSDVVEGATQASDAGAVGYFDKTDLHELMTNLTQLLNG